MKYLLLIMFYSNNILIGNFKIIPDYLPSICSKSDVNYNQCTLETLKNFGPFLLNGIEEINFPKLNPLVIPELICNVTFDKYVNAAIIMKNITVWGYESTIIKHFKFDPYRLVGEIRIDMNLSTTLKYKGAVNVFPVRIGSVGTANGSAWHVDSTYTFSLKPIERKNITYYDFDKFSVKGTLETIQIYLESEDPNYEILTHVIENMINNNKKVFLDVVEPIHLENINAFYKYLMKKVLASIPADELIPE